MPVCFVDEKGTVVRCTCDECYYERDEKCAKKNPPELEHTGEKDEEGEECECNSAVPYDYENDPDYGKDFVTDDLNEPVPSEEPELSPVKDTEDDCYLEQEDDDCNPLEQEDDDYNPLEQEDDDCDPLEQEDDDCNPEPENNDSIYLHKHNNGAVLK